MHVGLLYGVKKRSMLASIMGCRWPDETAREWLGLTNLVLYLGGLAKSQKSVWGERTISHRVLAKEHCQPQ